MPFSEDYVRSKFTHKDERGVFRLSDLNPPGGRGPVYEFRMLKASVTMVVFTRPGVRGGLY